MVLIIKNYNYNPFWEQHTCSFNHFCHLSWR